MKTQSLFLVFLVSLAICACENQWMTDILQVKEITFVSNGGSHVPSQTITKGERVSRPEDPVLAGYIFNNWFTDNGYFKKIWDFNVIPEGDMTLYASWIKGIQTPVAEDFTIEGIGSFLYYEFESKIVTITPKSGKSNGKITIYYQTADDDKTETPPFKPGKYMVTFDVSIAENWNAAYGLEAGTLVIYLDSASGLKNYLITLPSNDASYPYNIPLNVSSLDGILSAIIDTSTYDKYVNLDLSGSTINSISASAFININTLAGIIIPNSVTSIGASAFSGCNSLTSVTFQGTITENNLDNDAFGTPNGQMGDLRNKYLAGGPGTYTRPNGTYSVWTKL